MRTNLNTDHLSIMSSAVASRRAVATDAGSLQLPTPLPLNLINVFQYQKKKNNCIYEVLPKKVSQFS